MSAKKKAPEVTDTPSKILPEKLHQYIGALALTALICIGTFLLINTAKAEEPSEVVTEELMASLVLTHETTGSTSSRLCDWYVKVDSRYDNKHFRAAVEALGCDVSWTTIDKEGEE